MLPGLMTAPRRASVEQAWPRYAVCACGTEILLAASFGEPFRLERTELLPVGKCSGCDGLGLVIGDLRHLTTYNMDAKAPRYAQGPIPCALCAGSGRRGQNPTSEHVLVDALDGFGRPFDGDPRRGEAAHRRHACAALSAAA